jgi:UDP-glucose 4-epimerase
MKIFITGIAGFLGSHLAERLIELGHDVAGNDNLIGGYTENVPKQAVFFEVDCMDFDKMLEITKGYEVMVHCAATAHEGLSVISPNFITKNIYQASISTFTAAIENRFRRIVFMSSMARYGENPVPYNEAMFPKPVDPYGIAKLASEDTLRLLSETHGIEWNIAVPHNIVGSKQRFDDPFRNVMSIMINRIMRDLPPVIYGDGEQTRIFSNIKDCIFSIERLVLDDNVNRVIVNIGPDENPVSMNDLSDKILTIMQSSLKPIYYEDRPNEIKHAICSSDLSRKLFDYKTTVSLEQSINETINYIKLIGPRDFDYSYPLEINNHLTPKTWKKRLI